MATDTVTAPGFLLKFDGSWCALKASDISTLPALYTTLALDLPADKKPQYVGIISPSQFDTTAMRKAVAAAKVTVYADDEGMLRGLPLSSWCNPLRPVVGNMVLMKESKKPFGMPVSALTLSDSWNCDPEKKAAPKAPVPKTKATKTKASTSTDTPAPNKKATKSKAGESTDAPAPKKPRTKKKAPDTDDLMGNMKRFPQYWDDPGLEQPVLRSAYSSKLTITGAVHATEDSCSVYMWEECNVNVVFAFGIISIGPVIKEKAVYLSFFEVYPNNVEQQIVMNEGGMSWFANRDKTYRLYINRDDTRSVLIEIDGVGCTECSAVVTNFPDHIELQRKKKK